MCGIAGFIDFTKQSDRETLVQMTDQIRYRGPDSAGYDFFETPQCSIGLGHRRLSIIDLSPSGHQPMYTEDRQLAIIFNGEVYNYAEIKKELQEKNYSFRSGSDTEVILYAYREWGAEAVNRFTGMFAFVIYDSRQEKLLFCRDRAGVKPLYYYWHNNCFLFGSELKSIFPNRHFEKKLDVKSCFSYFQYSFVPAPHTIFKHTYKLEPGHYLELDLRQKTYSTRQYWNVLDYYRREKLDLNETDATAELERRLKKACDYRMVSDVPVGLFLSGGYDSSLVAAMLQSERTEKINTYTIGFPDKAFDEAPHAAAVAKHLGTNHHELYCTYNEAKEIIPLLAEYFDEPFADSSAIPSILVSRFARRQVTVALSADGGDELFAGYERHAALLQLQHKKNAVPSLFRGPAAAVLQQLPGFLLKRFFKGRNIDRENLSKYAGFLRGRYDITDMIDFANQLGMPDYVSAFFGKKESPHTDLFEKNKIRELGGPLDKLLAFDYLAYLPGDILTKVDRATMSVSLEGREPLLDQNLIEWVATLPDQYKYNGRSKYILRQIVHRYIPRELMERPKMGFSVPLVKWFREDLRFLFDEHLSEARTAEHGLIDAARLQQELKRYYAGNDHVFPLLWTFFMFQLWYKKWM